MAGTLAPKRHHSLAKSHAKIHSSIKLSGALLTEDGQTAKTRRGRVGSPKNTGKDRNIGLAPLGANQIN